MQRLLTQQEILNACKIMELSPDLFIRGGRDANNALRASYIELIKRHHPDVKRHPIQSHPDKGSLKHSLTFDRNRPSPVMSFESENKFADIQRAYNTLKTHLESRRIERASLWSFSSAPGFINRVPNPEDIQSILRSARPVPMHESGTEPIQTNPLSGPPPPPASFDGRVVPRPAHRAFLSFEVLHKLLTV